MPIWNVNDKWTNIKQKNLFCTSNIYTLQPARLLIARIFILVSIDIWQLENHLKTI